MSPAEEMAIELHDLAGECRQHEALMRARWGGDFSLEVFAEACHIVEYEREMNEDES